jgi:hypothetical protein
LDLHAPIRITERRNQPRLTNRTKKSAGERLDLRSSLHRSRVGRGGAKRTRRLPPASVGKEGRRRDGAKAQAGEAANGAAEADGEAAAAARVSGRSESRDGTRGGLVVRYGEEGGGVMGIGGLGSAVPHMASNHSQITARAQLS